jgi:hypothetical protein
MWYGVRCRLTFQGLVDTSMLTVMNVLLLQIKNIPGMVVVSCLPKLFNEKDCGLPKELFLGRKL